MPLAPQGRDADGDQGEPAATGEAPPRAASEQGAHVGLKPGNDLVDGGSGPIPPGPPTRAEWAAGPSATAPWPATAGRWTLSSAAVVLAGRARPAKRQARVTGPPLLEDMRMFPVWSRRVRRGGTGAMEEWGAPPAASSRWRHCGSRLSADRRSFASE